MLHPFNIHYWSCDVGHRHPFPTITNLKSPPGKSFILSMNVLPDQTITLGLQIILDHRSLSSVDHCNNFDKSMSQLWQTWCKTYSQWVSEWVTGWLTRQDNAWSDLGPKIFWLPPTLFQASPGFRRPGFKLLVHLEHLNNICKAHHRAQGRGQGGQPGQAAGGEGCLLYNIQEPPNQAGGFRSKSRGVLSERLGLMKNATSPSRGF